MPQEIEGRNYSTLSEQTKSVLQDFRDQVYEEHGCFPHSNRILVNLCYHLMWELTVALDETDGNWGESELFMQKHVELLQVLDYFRPNHPYGSEGPTI